MDLGGHHIQMEPTTLNARFVVEPESPDNMDCFKRICYLLDSLDHYDHQLSSTKAWGAAEAMRIASEYSAGTWTPVTVDRPPSDTPFIAWTANGKAMAISNAHDHHNWNWLVEKYHITHWLVLSPPKP